MNIQIKKLGHEDLDDFKALLQVFKDVFELRTWMPPVDAHLQNLLEQRGFFSLVAKMQGEVVGGLTGYLLDQVYSERPLAYIYDLAVQTTQQRKGVGSGLIRHLLHYGKVQGFEEVFVQADKVDQYALDFYRKTGATREEQVIHYSYTLH